MKHRRKRSRATSPRHLRAMFASRPRPARCATMKIRLRYAKYAARIRPPRVKQNVKRWRVACAACQRGIARVSASSVDAGGRVRV